MSTVSASGRTSSLRLWCNSPASFSGPAKGYSMKVHCKCKRWRSLRTFAPLISLCISYIYLRFKDVPKIDTRQGYSSSPHQSIDPHDTDLALQPQFSAVPRCTCHALSASSFTIFLSFYKNAMYYCMGTNVHRFFGIFRYEWGQKWLLVQRGLIY